MLTRGLFIVSLTKTKVTSNIHTYDDRDGMGVVDS
mgnify:CR=1 FL=1